MFRFLGLCVCVCNAPSICNRGFFLWTGITMIATMTFAIPYVFMSLFYTHTYRLLKAAAPSLPNQHASFNISRSLFKLMVGFCIPNLLGRVYLIFFNDHTFFFNRTVFQGSLAGKEGADSKTKMNDTLNRF